MSPTTFTLVGPAQLASLVRHLERRLADGKPLRVTVGVRPSRTREQNAFLHVAIRELADHVGMGEEELKTVLKSEYGPKVTRTLAGRTLNVPKSVSDYDTLEASAMIEHVERIAAECGLLLAPREVA